MQKLCGYVCDNGKFLIDDRYHSSFLINELNKLIPKNSFASYVIDTLGCALEIYIDELWEEDNIACFEPSPVIVLNNLFPSGCIYDPEYLSYTDGTYGDDNGKEIPISVPRTYSNSEQMAVYGLYLANQSKLEFLGESIEEEIKDYGYSDDEIIKYKAQFLLFSYQALVFAQQLLNNQTSSDNLSEIEKNIRKKLASENAKKRHEKSTYVKRSEVIEYWEKNIPPNLSNELAGERLHKEFPDFGLRTLVKYISAEKKRKKLQPTSIL